MNPAQNPKKPQHEIHHAIFKSAIGVCVYYKKITVRVAMFFLNAFHFFLLLPYLTNKETSTVLCSSL